MRAFSLHNYIDTEKLSSKQHVIISCLLLVGIFLVLGKYFTPIESLVAYYIGLAESEANDVAKSALITFGAARLINAAISFAQEVSFSIGFFGGADFSPFKVLEPIDDSIERFSEMLFYMLIAFKVMAIFFTPLIVLGDFALGAGLLGAVLKKYIIGLKHIDWPMKLITFGLFAYILPLSFLLAMKLGNLVIEDQIQREFTVFSSVIEEAKLGEITEVKTDVTEIEENDEQLTSSPKSEETHIPNQQICEEKSIWTFWKNNEEIPACTPASKLDEELKGQKSWWEFWKTDLPDDSGNQPKDNNDWWKFWKDSDDDPGIFSTLDSFWGLTLNVWDHIAQATKIVGILVLNTNTLIDASLTLLALYLIKLILIPALFLYFSIKVLKILFSSGNNFLDYSLEKMNPFMSKDK